MAFNVQSLSEIYETIKSDIEARLTSQQKVTRFSLLGVFAAALAGASHVMQQYIAWTSRQLTIQESDASITTKAKFQGNKYNLYPKVGEYAEGIVKFSGVNSTVIPDDTELESDNGAIFQTQAEATIAAGIASVAVKAALGSIGIIGNIPATDSISLVEPITDIDSDIIITTIPTGGEDPETTIEYDKRLLERTRNNPASGAPADYVRWAKEVNGVDLAWTLTANEFLGAGTVGVIVLNSALNQVSAAVLAAADAYINDTSRRPIKADVTVSNGETKDVNIDMDITPNTSDLQSAITAKLTNLFIAKTEPAGTILISEIRTTIGTSGVTDYAITSITKAGISVAIDDITSTGIEVLKYGTSSYGSL